VAVVALRDELGDDRAATHTVCMLLRWCRVVSCHECASRRSARV
jgi:hypothetical protein